MKFNYELHKLKNGTQILLIPSKEPYSVNVTALLRSGGAFEDTKNSGITHFLEHTTMQATEKWPDKVKLNRLLEELGGMSNAETNYEVLKYYLTVPYNKLDFAVDFIYQVLYKSIFDENYVEVERTIILDELHKRLDNVNYRNFMFVQNSVSKNKTAYSLPILGNEKNIKSFTRKDLLKYRNFYHDPSRLLLVITGNFNVEKIKDSVTNKFNKVKTKNVKFNYPKQVLKTNVIKTKPDRDKTNLVYNTLVIPYKGRKDITKQEATLAHLSANILGGPLTSRLMHRLREKEGLLYDIYAYIDLTYNSGTIAVYANYDPAIFKKVFPIIVDEINEFAKVGISKTELDHFKNFIINHNLVKYDNVYAISSLISTPIFYNQKVYSVKDINKTIKEVTLKEINEYIKKYFNLSKASAFAYGNTNSSMTKVMKNALQLK